jgi:hypothetical protein
VQPHDLGTFAAVCEVLNRHAGRLDRLDYMDCVTDLLRHVGEVRLECETDGLVPTVAHMAGGAVHYEQAPPRSGRRPRSSAARSISGAAPATRRCCPGNARSTSSFRGCWRRIAAAA